MLLIFVDLDDLKDINDPRLGHATGDRALVDLGTVLKSTFRERDVVARLGGDGVRGAGDGLLGRPRPDLLARLANRPRRPERAPGRECRLGFSTGVPHRRSGRAEPWRAPLRGGQPDVPGQAPPQGHRGKLSPACRAAQLAGVPLVRGTEEGFLSLRQLPQHELQDPAVLVVVDLVRRIDAAGDGERLLRPVVARGLHLELLAAA